MLECVLQVSNAVVISCHSIFRFYFKVKAIFFLSCFSCLCNILLTFGSLLSPVVKDYSIASHLK